MCKQNQENYSELHEYECFFIVSAYIIDICYLLYVSVTNIDFHFSFNCIYWIPSMYENCGKMTDCNYSSTS